MTQVLNENVLGLIKGDKGEKGDPGFVGAGVYGLNIENGDLILYMAVDAAEPTYNINSSGDLTVTIN